MISSKKKRVFLSNIIIAMYCTLCLVILPSVDLLHLKTLQSSLIEQCCKVKSRSHAYKLAKLVMPNAKLTPDEGQTVQLYQTPFYHQYINKEICYNNYNSKSICQQGTCQQEYIKQEAIVHERHFKRKHQISIQEVWVESGCKFVPRKVHRRRKG